MMAAENTSMNKSAGIPRKINDCVVNFHNYTVRWNNFNCAGIDLLKEISNQVLQNSTEDDVDRIKVNELYVNLDKIYSQMSDLVEKMMKVSSQLKYLTETHQTGQNLTQKEMNKLHETSISLFISFRKELGVKQNVIKEVSSHVKRRELMYLLCVWTHEIHLDLVKFGIDVMLCVIGKKNPSSITVITDHTSSSRVLRSTDTESGENIYKYFQNAFVCMDNLISRWDSIINSNYNLIESFLTFVDQLNCIKSIKLDTFMSPVFCSLKDKLEFKIENKIKDELIGINKALSNLDEIVTEMKRNIDNCEKEWNINENKLGIECFIAPKGFHPPIFQLIQWLEDVYECYNAGLILRKCLVLSYEINDECERLMTEWKRDCKNEDVEVVLINMKMYCRVNLKEVDLLPSEDELEELKQEMLLSNCPTSPN